MGYKENTYGIGYLTLQQAFAAMNEDWRPYVYLTEQLKAAHTDMMRYVLFDRISHYSMARLKEANADIPGWAKGIGRFYAYQIQVQFSGRAESESTDKVSIFIGNKKYSIDCGSIIIDGTAEAGHGQELSYKGGLSAAYTGPYAGGKPITSSEPLVRFTAREQVTVTDLSLSGGGGAGVSSWTATVKTEDGTVTDFTWEKGDAFTVLKGAELALYPKIYDPTATGPVFSGTYALNVTYKNTEGKTKTVTRGLVCHQNSGLYFHYLQQFKGANLRAYYEYVVPFLDKNVAVLEEKYGLTRDNIMIDLETYYEYVNSFVETLKA